MENKKIYTPVEVELKNNLMFLKSLNKPFNGTVEYPIDKTSTVKVPYKDGIQHGKKYEIFKNNFNIHHWDNGQLILSEFYIENICYLKKIYNGKVLIEQHFSYERPEPQIIMAGVGGGQSPIVPPDDNQSSFIDNAFGDRPTEREKWNDIRYKFG